MTTDMNHPHLRPPIRIQIQRQIIVLAEQIQIQIMMSLYTYCVFPDNTKYILLVDCPSPVERLGCFDSSQVRFIIIIIIIIVYSGRID